MYLIKQFSRTNVQGFVLGEEGVGWITLPNIRGPGMTIIQFIRVLLVDDHTMVREGLRSVLETYPNIEIVGQAGDGEAAINMVAKLRPVVVLMDINLPKMDGITATRFIKNNYPEIAVIGFSMTVHSYSEYAMLKAGAFEVLAKDRPVHDLYAAIQRAVASVRPVVILKDVPVQDSASSEKAASEGSDSLSEKSIAPQDEGSDAAH
jgi:DNA-binding NarL/FixJ family response regulator